MGKKAVASNEYTSETRNGIKLKRDTKRCLSPTGLRIRNGRVSKLGTKRMNQINIK